jgi:hypothetical protein
LLQWSLRFGQDADCGVHVGYREVCQVTAVAAVDGHVHSKDFFIGKNPDLVRLAGLQLIDELLTPLLPCFFSVGGQKRPLDDHAALQSQVLLRQFLMVLGSIL